MNSIFYNVLELQKALLKLLIQVVCISPRLIAEIKVYGKRKLIQKCKLMLRQIKLINNRWAWGRCLERWWGLEHRSRARRVTMTTLWAATTRHRHTDKRQWNHDTYHILTGKRGREGRGVKSPSTVEKAKVHVQMSWPQNPSCKTTRPPADPPPLRMTETRETPDQHCFAFNLA